MTNDLWGTFGFRESPYGTRALSSEEGSKLLVGREEEVNWLTLQLTSTSRVPILTGDNGVGKTSIANVVAYRLCTEHREGDSRYFDLFLDQIDTQLEDLKFFEQNLYHKIIRLLLKEKSFLRQCGISFAEIIFVSLRMSIISGISIGPFAFEVDKSSAAEYLRQVAWKWLKKCFCDLRDGGIICIIDNLENDRTSRQVQGIVERMRDTLFNIPGLRWILCGTHDVIKGTLASKLLSGYIANLAVDPVDESVAPMLVQHRIEYFGGDNSDSPVDKEGFQFIYEAVVNRQLRIALKLCEDFAQHLYINPARRMENRANELRLWLNQKAATLPVELREIPDASWTFFVNIADFGTDFISTEYRIFGITSKDELNEIVQPLIDNGLLVSITTDEGYLLRVTETGWLVYYRRKQSNEN